MNIPKDVNIILSTLEKAGYTAYIVGGCVRDMLMQKKPHDWDITTSAKPHEVKSLFSHTYDTGILHGTVTVLFHDVPYEVTTYRIESDYNDCRHPNTVYFVDRIEDDLSRRDFTMNAIAYNPSCGFVDPYQGREAIAQQTICSVRSASERFSEDALRILRAIRFSAQLNFTIEGDTLNGIKTCKALLRHISKERIRDELGKILLSMHPEQLQYLNTLDVTPYLLNKPNSILLSEAIQMCSFALLRQSPILLTIRLALLLQNHMAKSLLKELKYDNQTIQTVTTLIQYHSYFEINGTSKITIKKLLGKIGNTLFDMLLTLEQVYGHTIDKQKSLKEQILLYKEPYLLSHLAITGNDLIQAGVTPGKKIGKLLNLALEKVIEDPTFNHKKNLIAYCMTHYSNIC